MLLAVDVGNTNINLGVFKGSRLVRRYTILAKEKPYLRRLKKICLANRVKEAIISSVVPLVGRRMEKGLSRLLAKRPYYIGKNIEAGVVNLYRDKKQVGSDRLANALAGIRLYGSPLIVVDFGTGITFDVISKKQQYLGGMILPGLGISLAALAERTALLPKAKLGRPKEFIGRDTKSGMLSGLVFGFAALTDELADRIKNKIGRNAKVIATGGDARLIAKYCRRIDKIDPDLTLKGLNFIYRGR